MKLNRLFILLTAICISVSLSVAGATSPSSERFSLNCITMNEGLKHNFVDDLFRDSGGFIWVATSGSLARYDGYEFVNFMPNSVDRYIKSPFVRKVAEDGFRRLWVANDGGIDVIDLDKMTSVMPPDPTGALERISSIPAGYIYTSPENGDLVWIRNMKEIVCLQLDADGTVASAASIPHNCRGPYAASAIKPAGKSGDGVWTPLNGSICRLEYAPGKISATPAVPGLTLEPDVFVSDFITCGPFVWIATEVGLYRWDTRNGDVAVYHGIPGIEGTLSQNFINALTVGPDGKLVAGSLNGLNIYDEQSDTFHHLKASDIRPNLNGLNNNFVNCLLSLDSHLWVGTEGGGINIFSPKTIHTETLRHNPSRPESLSANPVNAIYEDNDGTLWIGTVEGGLNRSQNGGRDAFSHFSMEEGTLSHNSVSAIAADRNGQLWVGTWGGGINVLERRNPANVIGRHISTSDAQHKLDYIGTLIYDPLNNAMWIGASSGIYVYYIESDILTTPFPGATDLKGSVASAISTDGKLWIGGLDGLVEIDLKRDYSNNFKVTKHTFKLDHPETKVREKVTALEIAHDGTIWVGTNGNGIYRRTVEDGKETFVNYNTSNGLPNDVVHGIAEDPHGNVWIATYHGLACMQPDGIFLTFGKSNGLDTEQFYWNASLRKANGDILFGSVDGLLIINGLDTSRRSCTFPVVFTSLTVNGEKSFAVNGGRCGIHENEKSFEVGFSSLDYSAIKRGHFLYRMEGFDNEWKELPAGRNSVAYTNLSPGGYTLEVKYVSPGQSAASAPVSKFDIEIIPHFYKRWWFIILAALAAVAAILAIYRWRVGDLTRQRNQLRNAVDKGVKEISHQKDLIEEHARELANQNEELKLRNQQISQQKAQLSEMARKVQQLTVDRISFFTNITHEFRTPITLIIGPIERALKLSTNPKVIEQLNFVERNSRYLLSLVNQLMDFRKVESGKMDIMRSPSDFSQFIDEIVPPFKAYAEERGIELRTLCHFSSPVFSFDKEALRKILNNLLGNAIKFTPDNGRITLYATLFSSGNCEYENTLYLCVSDTGNGINEEDIEKVFDRFYQGKSQIKYPLIGGADSGVGLYLCRKIVEVYGGKISVRNNRGAGCSFRVLLNVPETELGSQTSEKIPSSLPLMRAEDPASASGERLTVLVVEDNRDMRAFMRSILSDHYNVVEAENGEAALKLLLAHPVDFIISDLMMPVMDGLELSRQVKENFAISHIPFLMLTAKTAGEARLESYRNGVDEYLLKPFDEEMLLARIKNIIENKRRYQRQFNGSMDSAALHIDEDSSDKKFIDKVIQVARDNYQNSYFEVADFAEALGVSRSLLNKKLQSLTGESPNQFIRSFRLKMAHELLLKNRKTRSMNISEIAFEVGFNDSKYFTRCFTKQFGVNPSALLKQE